MVLFLSWRDPMPGQFTIGPVIDTCLFAHGLPANAILAGFTDTSFEGHQHFSADHTFFLFFAHGDDFIPDGAPLPSFQSSILICSGFSRISSSPYRG